VSLVFLSALGDRRAAMRFNGSRLLRQHVSAQWHKSFPRLVCVFERVNLECKDYKIFLLDVEARKPEQNLTQKHKIILATYFHLSQNLLQLIKDLASEIRNIASLFVATFSATKKC
jgi:hypothetical protein